MKICILAAGAAGMFCGSCMRDNVLASALLRAGHKVTLVPLYTPLRTEARNVSVGEVFFGGVNTWLQHATRLFRHTPRAVDWLLDRPWLLDWAGGLGVAASPAKLGSFVVDLLNGEDGPVAKELRRLMAYLRDDVKPDVVSLPNLMFMGTARLLRRELAVPVVCELTGEDIFLDGLIEPHRTRARDIIRRRAQDVNTFVATSEYYADEMAVYLDQPRERMKVVHPGLASDFLNEVAVRIANSRQPAKRPPTVAYLARICPEKGIDQLVDAMILLRAKPGFTDARLRIGGWLGKGNEKWFAKLLERANRCGLAGAIDSVGELTREQKIDLLFSADVVSVPTAYREAKGIYILESLAAGVPVVQSDHGSFPELVRLTGGGILAPANDPAALADRLAELLGDAPRRARLGQAGRAAVLSMFTDEQMAAKMLQVYEEARENG